MTFVQKGAEHYDACQTINAQNHLHLQCQGYFMYSLYKYKYYGYKYKDKVRYHNMRWNKKAKNKCPAKRTINVTAVVQC
jgi:hypothetical protein